MRFNFVLAVFLVKCIFLLSFPCEKFFSTEERKLVVFTCDTRSGWKEFQALKLWNSTGANLWKDRIFMKNVCKGENWGRLGFLTKPLLYRRSLQLILEQESTSSVYVILMDSDTFWSATNIDHIWHNYDCARRGKDLVVSSEMSCWVGRYCNASDISRWYSDTSKFTSYSPFVNSGVVMGRANSVKRMLDYIILNNHSYYTTYGRKFKFDDQYAIADYALNIASHEISVDYHQQISASCSIHAPGDPPDSGWPFVCRSRNGTIAYSCHIYNNLLRRQGHFSVDPFTCLVHRVIRNGMPLQQELSTLSLTPIIWHGNGKTC